MVFGALATGIFKGPSGNITLVLGPGQENVTAEIVDHLPMPVQDAIFALTAMPVVIFFSFFVSILYYYGVMQVIVKQLGWLLQVSVGTTAAESISASGNIFLGMVSDFLEQFWCSSVAPMLR